MTSAAAHVPREGRDSGSPTAAAAVTQTERPLYLSSVEHLLGGGGGGVFGGGLGGGVWAAGAGGGSASGGALFAGAVGGGRGGGGGGLYLCAPLMAVFGPPGLEPLAGTAGRQTSAHQVKLRLFLSPSMGLVPVEGQ